MDNDSLKELLCAMGQLSMDSLATLATSLDESQTLNINNNNDTINNNKSNNINNIHSNHNNNNNNLNNNNNNDSSDNLNDNNNDNSNNPKINTKKHLRKDSTASMEETIVNIASDTTPLRKVKSFALRKFVEIIEVNIHRLDIVWDDVISQLHIVINHKHATLRKFG